METQGLLGAVEAAQPEPGTQQHGGSVAGNDGVPSSAPSASGPVRRQPQRRDSAAAAAPGGGLDVAFPVLLLLEGEKPPEPPPPLPPPPPPQLPAAPPGPSAATFAALQPGAGGPGQQDSDALLLVLNLVRGGASGSLSGGPPQDPPPPQQKNAGSSRGGGEAPLSAPSEAGGRQQKHPQEDSGAGSSFSGTLTINNQSLLVRFENGLLSLGGPAPPQPPSSAAETPASAPASGSGGGQARTAAAYPCPEPRCAEIFSRKQLLRLHRLSAHGANTTAPQNGGGGGGGGGEAEASAGSGRSARPFCCPVPGCAWAFATAYKLRRHLHSHDKLRPFACSVPGCTKRFTTIYNLRAHGRAHEQEAAHKCEACGQRFPSAARLGAHQRRSHLEPDRPYRCEYPGCERTFITVSALFSHNRVHFREQELFSCSFPGCSKQYDKACRLKIHMRSHTGERPFICDFEGCGWSFTSMSKLLRHKRKHEDDRRFTCSVEGCGKSFTRAEHLKGHSITHLGTKPFECPVEGCCAKFSARSSLYIHSKKHLQDVDSLKTRCPVSSCNKLFTSKHSMKTHMVKQHNFSADLLNQMETISSLTPSSELTNSGQNDLSNIDLVSLFSSVSGNSSGISTDMALTNSGILTIDVASVGSTLGGNLSVGSNSLGQTVDPLILVASSDIPHSLDSSLLLGSNATVLQQSTLNLDDVQTVNAQALGSLASLSTKNSNQDLHGLTSSNNFSIDTATLTPSSNLGGNNAPELLASSKAEQTLLPSLDVVGQQEGSKVVTQFVFSNPPGSYSAQKETDLSMVTGSSFLESGGSARTDYRAIQLAKKRKQKGNESDIGAPTSGIRKGKGDKISPSSHGTRLCNSVLPNGGLPVRESPAGTQYVQMPLLQDDSPGEGDLPFQLSSQSSSSHSQLTVDLPVHILQEPHNSNEEDASSDNSQFTGSTINLQDLE
ncbi:zinc finger protein ZXDC [Eublepharis macularius]|uniref:Zinc finger protein ZXDC n=1 Tax=Eublepharis macularius TaxID=481883 RepID=A0AA97JAV0_EUBMA|nr:zinc finger protein ZXDC [Eublepharis macularius]